MLYNHESMLLLTLLSEGAISDLYASAIEDYELYNLDEHLDRLREDAGIEIEEIEFLDTNLDGEVEKLRAVRLTPKGKKRAILVLQAQLDYFTDELHQYNTLPSLDFNKLVKPSSSIAEEIH